MKWFQRQWWYIERPFPFWPLIAVIATACLAAILAIEIWRLLP